MRCTIKPPTLELAFTCMWEQRHN